MKALIITLIVLSVLALIPIGVDGGYDSHGLRLYAKIGLLNIRLVPAGSLLSSIKNKKPKKKKAASVNNTPEAPKEPPQKKLPEKEDILALAKLVLRALGRFRRKLTVDYLRIHYIAASSDPFKAAMSYGRANVALAAAIPLFENAFDIRERDFGTHCDFMSNKQGFDIWLTTSIRLWEILYVAITALFEYKKFKARRKKLQKAA